MRHSPCAFDRRPKYRFRIFLLPVVQCPSRAHRIDSKNGSKICAFSFRYGFASDTSIAASDGWIDIATHFSGRQNVASEWYIILKMVQKLPSFSLSDESLNLIITGRIDQPSRRHTLTVSQTFSAKGSLSFLHISPDLHA